MNNKSALAAAVAVSLGGASTVVDAATFQVQLNSVTSYSSGGSLSGNLALSTATFSYDAVTNLLTQTGGIFNVRYTLSPIATLFRHSITGLVIGNGAAASAATYVCTEGNFGANVSANLCGNFSFGADFNNQSTVTWGPGTATARTVGGDDVALGPQQSITAYNGFTTSSWNGTTLVLSNAAPSGSPTTGFQMTLSAVPVPAAVWLFGSALGVMGWMRRKTAT